MNPFDLIKALLSNISPEKWIVSVNTVRKGPVTRTFSKLQGTNIVVDFEYEDGDILHKLEGTIPLVDAGKPGGNDQFKFDGKDVEHDDFVLSNRVVFPSGIMLIVEFKFILNAQEMRIRFDGKMTPI